MYTGAQHSNLGLCSQDCATGAGDDHFLLAALGAQAAATVEDVVATRETPVAQQTLAVGSRVAGADGSRSGVPAAAAELVHRRGTTRCSGRCGVHRGGVVRGERARGRRDCRGSGRLHLSRGGCRCGGDVRGQSGPRTSEESRECRGGVRHRGWGPIGSGNRSGGVIVCVVRHVPTVHARAVGRGRGAHRGRSGARHGPWSLRTVHVVLRRAAGGRGSYVVDLLDVPVLLLKQRVGRRRVEAICKYKTNDVMSKTAGQRKYYIICVPG